MSASLLVEIRTEELPPKSLKRLSEAFGKTLVESLAGLSLLELAKSEAQVFATPRRLAVRITNVRDKQVDRVVERKGPTVAAGLDANGQPTPALAGFAKSCGVEVGKLERVRGDKGEQFAFRFKQKGEPLAKHLAGAVETALKKLPVAKLMRWGSGDAQFVRPVHGVILLHGSTVVAGTVLGLKSTNRTLGHRFLSKGPVVIAHADKYVDLLRKKGMVIAEFDARRAEIEKQLNVTAAKVGTGARWNLGKSIDLLDEVTSIVEFPVVLEGRFEESFLAVPRECLVISMQQHQKYFPLADASGKLLPRFLFVSNVRATNPKQIIHGNERVLRARLSDARFFFDQDRKIRLDARTPRLGNVVYHNKLGSQLDRVERLQKLASEIARRLGANAAHAERAAYLAKADLLTDMVGEFPELQGLMGRYYAEHDGESADVVQAIEQHYWPRFAGDGLPTSALGSALALAERLDVLAGMFGIGQQPTGDKDPFGLRRAALGVVRLLVEKQLSLSMFDLINLAFASFPQDLGQAQTDVAMFVRDRLSGYLRDAGYSAQQVDAVLASNPARLDELPDILVAVKAFQRLPEAEALAAANKRIVNILKKAGREFANADRLKLVEPAEQALYDALARLRPDVEASFRARDYTGALQALAGLKQPVDAFFDKVMVMAEDVALRENRLALLGDLKQLMNRVADISRLAV